MLNSIMDDDENIDNDKITLNALDFKQLGEAINSVKIHLASAHAGFLLIEKRCKHIEKQTGIKMNFTL